MRLNIHFLLSCSASLDLADFQDYLREHQKLATESHPSEGATRPGQFATRIPFYSPSVEKQVLSFLDFASSIPQPEIAELFRVAFGAVTVNFSNYTYEPSLGSRPGAGKPLVEKADVRATILRKLSEMVSDIQWIGKRTGNAARWGEGQI